MRPPLRLFSSCAAFCALFAANATAQTSALDSARNELRIGRSWHAAGILAPLHDSAQLGPEGLLLLAEADAGYRDWAGVRSALAGADWLVEQREGEGLRLLGRAFEEEGRFAEAASAYLRYLSAPAGIGAVDRPAIRARLARVLARSGGDVRAGPIVDSLAREVDTLGSWLALDLATAASEAGDTAGVDAFRRSIRISPVAGRGWELPALAHLQAGDSAGAERLYRSALDSLADGSSVARAWGRVGSLRLAARDTAAARVAYLSSLEASPTGPSSATAAGRLLAFGVTDPKLALVVARALDRAGDVRGAAEAYDLYTTGSPTPVPLEVRLARARILSLTSGRQDEALEEFRALADAITDRTLGVRNLALWSDLRRRQGRSGDVATIQGWIVERYPESPEAVELVFFRGDAAHDRGALNEALAEYERLQRMNPSLDRSGLARMRMAQIHLRRGDREGALSIYRGYLDDFPDGRRWDEATYWIGRILLESGDTAGAGTVLRGVGERNPLSYYAIRGDELLGEPYRLPAFQPESEEVEPPWLTEGLRNVDLLDAAGLEQGRAATVEELREQARASSDGAFLCFARALLDRGLMIDAINLGWELRDRGHPWTRELMELLYPFPYREMVTRAAREEGLDPTLVAALIRQESAFDADIVSPAGAVGLMQVMPATGRELARRFGPENFSTGSLEAPDVNLHLGTRFLREMWDRYSGSLPLVLSAYNAGPQRASEWRSFPEASDATLFTDRIPFRETRDYVKLVTRNFALYAALYGGS